MQYAHIFGARLTLFVRSPQVALCHCFLWYEMVLKLFAGVACGGG